MSWYYCSGCSQDLLDDIQIATMDVDNSWPFILSCSNSVLMVFDLQLFLHRAISQKEKSCLELKKSWYGKVNSIHLYSSSLWGFLNIFSEIHDSVFLFILSSECGEVVEVSAIAVNKLYSSWFSAVKETKDILVWLHCQRSGNIRKLTRIRKFMFCWLNHVQLGNWFCWLKWSLLEAINVINLLDQGQSISVFCPV